MDETTLKIALSAFLHDIGKLADRDTLDIPQDYIDRHAGVYLPVYKGEYSHYHAVYTSAFIEQAAQYLPDQCNQPVWGEGDPFINLAAGHHNPDTPMQWIVAVADRIASGWERDTLEKVGESPIHWRDYKKTRMFGIFEQLMVERTEGEEAIEHFSYHYPLEPVSPGAIFPIKKGTIDLREKDPAAEYRALFAGFFEGLKGLRHRKENPVLWFEHLDSLMMRYTSSVPSARAGNVLPDVSLYDHSRITAGFAEALYLFHRDRGTLSVEAIKGYDEPKFLIISGDFYGIQEFIFSGYGDTRKHRSKLLRGRSLAVSLMTELAADMICKEIGLGFISVVINAAGRFSILAPNTEKAIAGLEIAARKMNDWLVRVSYGEMSIGISSVDASPNDFVEGRFVALWDRIGEAVAEKKYTRIDLDDHGGPVKYYLDDFVSTLSHALCPICGKRPSSPSAENSSFTGGKGYSSCRLCRDHIFLGTNLVKRDRLAVTTSDASIRGEDSKLLEPLLDAYQVAFLEGDLHDMAREGSLLKLWNLGGEGNGVTAKYIKGYAPTYGPEDERDERFLAGAKTERRKMERIVQVEPGEPMTLGHIACKALSDPDEKGRCFGLEALGVLKADVDHMGKLMACGLGETRLTFSRLATLSRQLNWFFALYLPDLLMRDPRFHEVYTVFAGGDDLFLIGPWNRMIEFAVLLQERFSEYVCRNPEIHYSAGIALVKPMTPIDVMAQRAEEAIEASKSKGRNRITLFSQTVTWDEMNELLAIKETLTNWLSSGWINQAMLHRLNTLISMAGEETRLKGKNEILLDELDCTRWRFLLAYSCGRNVARDLKKDAEKAREKVAAEVMTKLTKWLMDYGGKFVIPLWTILYNNR